MPGLLPMSLGTICRTAFNHPLRPAPSSCWTVDCGCNHINWCPMLPNVHSVIYRPTPGAGCFRSIRSQRSRLRHIWVCATLAINPRFAIKCPARAAITSPKRGAAIFHRSSRMVSVGWRATGAMQHPPVTRTRSLQAGANKLETMGDRAGDAQNCAGRSYFAVHRSADWWGGGANVNSGYGWLIRYAGVCGRRSLPLVYFGHYLLVGWNVGSMSGAGTDSNVLKKYCSAMFI